MSFIGGGSSVEQHALQLLVSPPSASYVNVFIAAARHGVPTFHSTLLYEPIFDSGTLTLVSMSTVNLGQPLETDRIFGSLVPLRGLHGKGNIASPQDRATS